MQNKNKIKTVTGTDIDEVKRLNAQSGLSYNEAKVMLAEQKGFSSDKQRNNIN
ncbi:hypothetical protein [Halalkalibacter nanhaiisediminis]|uniref:Uncharacterized protein n=1 Tax=Halalkalibacter nanhaiisediminis TaxID=688079 RepID=A0A562QD63_9BACI|nr:hypothetical protein [Halalkalibacter nanhaiisediminis]TWI54705.1 hypothetical protein IQ10_02930 [Halalkalibacter nanhaiisediminis]